MVSRFGIDQSAELGRLGRSMKPIKKGLKVMRCYYSFHHMWFLNRILSQLKIRHKIIPVFQ